MFYYDFINIHRVIKDGFLSGKLKGSQVFVLDSSYYLDYDCCQLIKSSGLYKDVKRFYPSYSDVRTYALYVVNELKTSSILIDEDSWNAIRTFIYCKEFRDVSIHYIKPETRINCLGVFI